MKSKIMNLKVISLAAQFAVASILFTSCQKDEPIATPVASNNPEIASTKLSNNAVIIRSSTNPFGLSYAGWGAKWWKWTYSFDCAHNPLLDADGSLQDQGQSGPVYFLSGAQFNVPTTRNVTISSTKAIFFPLITEIIDYPDPNDTSYHPAAGQSLQDFLTQQATSDVDGVDILSATLDGNAINNLSSLRATSSLFTFTGNPDVANCIDNFITGTRQKGVTDGYFMMLQPLSVGNHTLHFTGGLSANIHHPLLLIDVTYNISVN